MNLRSGYPYSLIKNGLVSNYPKPEKNCSIAMAISGGGISGALTAHYLTQQHIPYVIVDARSIGLGTTCASTSRLQYEIDTPLHKSAITREKMQQDLTGFVRKDARFFTFDR